MRTRASSICASANASATQVTSRAARGESCSLGVAILNTAAVAHPNPELVGIAAPGLPRRSRSTPYVIKTNSGSVAFSHSGE
eukprot:5116164-Amphidinium_carterae.2